MDSVKDNNYYILKIGGLEGSGSEWVGMNKCNSYNKTYPYKFIILSPKLIGDNECVFRANEIIRKPEPWEVVTKKMLGEL